MWAFAVAAVVLSSGCDRSPPEPTLPPHVVWIVLDTLGASHVGLHTPGLEGLRERDWWKDTLLIVTSDHGEAFREHEQLGHASAVYAEQVRVPLLIRFPRGIGPEPGVERSPVELVDVVPTLLSFLAIEPEMELDGTSLLAPESKASPRHARAWFRSDMYDTDQASVTDGRYRLIRIDGRAELYDLETDGGEQVDIATRHPAIVEALMPHLDQAPAEAVPVRIDEETIRQLRALGYDPGTD